MDDFLDNPLNIAAMSVDFGPRFNMLADQNIWPRQIVLDDFISYNRHHFVDLDGTYVSLKRFHGTWSLPATDVFLVPRIGATKHSSPRKVLSE
jgi:hypothetical protein